MISSGSVAAAAAASGAFFLLGAMRTASICQYAIGGKLQIGVVWKLELGGRTRQGSRLYMGNGESPSATTLVFPLQLFIYIWKYNNSDLLGDIHHMISFLL
jgi:hypothetical protein